MCNFPGFGWCLGGRDMVERVAVFAGDVAGMFADSFAGGFIAG